MLATRIIPCLDVADGKIVKGTQFQNLRDAGDPVEAAKRYGEEGADELAVLDISASNEGRKTTIELVDLIASQVFIPLTVGGGISELDDIKTLLRAGADKVSINSAAVMNPEFVRQAATSFGSQCITIALDVKCSEAKPGAWEVYSHSGKRPTGLDAVAWAKRVVELGAGEILLTSMDRDGSKEGFDLEITRQVSEAVPVPVIASGGVGNLEHLVDGIVKGRADAVLAASIFHFKEYSIAEAKKLMSAQGIIVRD